MSSQAPQVVIVGAGPSGCALACFLRLRNIPVVLFDGGSRPELLVGESLIPAAIPLLQRLGVEAAVRRVSRIKPGATLMHGDGTRLDFTFRKIGKKATGYAYNIPRPEFDHILRERAESLGATIINSKAKLTVRTPNDSPNYGSTQLPSSPDLALSAESSKQAGIDNAMPAPLLIDATGRNRLFSRLLGLAAKKGGRDDIAYFAHFDNFEHNEVPDGQVLITIQNRGWSWRIPLADKLSVGVVVNRHAARQFGSSAEERFETIIKAEPLLATKRAKANRISPVRTFSNYQLISEQSYGNGWALVGDAFGFVDPMLSPGVFMALESASLLDQHIATSANQVSARNMAAYATSLNDWHIAWTEVIDYLYDGRLLQFCEAGNQISQSNALVSAPKFFAWYYTRMISSLVSGAHTRSVFRRRALKAGSNYLQKSMDEIERHAVIG